MTKVNRILINICSDKLKESTAFYTKLFDLQIAFESDWFVQLISDNKQFELGIIDKNHEIVPKGFQNNPQGFYLTFVVDEVDQVFEIAKNENYDIVAEPEDTFYGQRRLLLKDPNGALVDVSSPIKGFNP